MPSNQTNRALEQAVEEYRQTGKHTSQLVRDVTTERTLTRWINGEVRPNPFASRRIAERLNRPYKELFPQ